MIGDVLDRKAIAGRTKEQWWIHCVCREYSQQGQFDPHDLRFALSMRGDCGLPPDKESNRIPPPGGLKTCAPGFITEAVADGLGDGARRRDRGGAFGYQLRR
jgi:hypothetical protein